MHAVINHLPLQEESMGSMRAVLRTSIIHLVGLAAVLVFTAGPASSQKSSFEIVDVHAHFLPSRNLTFEKAVDSAIRLMDRYGVARTIVMSPPRSAAVKLNYEYPDFRPALKKHSGRFEYLGGGGTLNPALHQYADPHLVTDAVKADFAETARNAINDGAKGFGEMSSLHISLSLAHAYSFVSADHPLLLILADVAAEKNVPLDIHMDALNKEQKTPAALAQYPNNPSEFPATISALKRLLSHNPDAKIIWAHGGTDHLGDFSAKAIRTLMDDHSNLFVSLKVVGPKAPTHNKLFNRSAVDPEWLALFRRHSARFMIGTDNFYVDSEAGLEKSITGFSDANEPKLSASVRFLSLLPKDLAEKIASENAIRVFELSPSRAMSSSGSVNSTPEKSRSPQGGLCKDGNIDHCKTVCAKGVRSACNRLKRGR